MHVLICTVFTSVTTITSSECELFDLVTRRPARNDSESIKSSSLFFNFLYTFKPVWCRLYNQNSINLFFESATSNYNFEDQVDYLILAETVVIQIINY